MLTLLSLLSVAPAQAAACDALLAGVDGLAPEAVAAAWTELARCDRKPATVNFTRFMEKANDAENLGALLVAAAEMDASDSAWGALELIKDYSQRDEVAAVVGAACADKPKVVDFLKGAYTSRKPSTFKQWDDAWLACTSEALWTYAASTVAAPPDTTFDEKYDMLVDIYVRHARVDALPTLADAAVKASSSGGPFEALVTKMGEAVAPGLGAKRSDEATTALATALGGVAAKVPADKASLIASTLAANGAESAAAALLPKVYADRVQKGGTFLYGVAVVEAGTCAGAKSAVVHTLAVTEPGKRWTLDTDLEAATKALKPRLDAACADRLDPALVLHSPEPLKDSAAVSAWQEGVVTKWQGDGYVVKTQKEKAITLP